MSASFTFKRQAMEEKKNELLEPGLYEFTILNAYDLDLLGEPLVSKSGTSYFKLVCQEMTTEVTIFHYLFLESTQAAKVSVFLTAIGYDFEDGEEIKLSPDTFKGHFFQGRVENLPGKDGVVRNKITRVTTLPKEEPAPEPGDVELEVTDAPEEEVTDALGAAQPCPPPPRLDGLLRPVEPTDATEEEEDQIPF